MDTDDLVDPMNDFLPLLPENIKQELFETTTEKGNLCDSVETKGDVPENAGDAAVPTKCVWCSQLLSASDLPKLMECLHIACDACVKLKFADLPHNSVIFCPICKMENRSDFIIENQFLSETSGNEDDKEEDSAKDTIKCSSCSDDAVATSWCVECSEFICDSCVQAHQRLKITKDHTIKTKDAACSESQNSALSGKNIMCHIHSQEKLSLYCETCDRLTCRDCQLVDHRDHKYKFANEIATETRTNLSALLSEITYKKVLLSSAMKVIDDRQALITEKKKELSKEITDLVVKLTNAVNMRGKQLVYRLNQVCDTKLQVLNEKKDALQQLSGHTDHCIEFVQNALDKGSDSAVLYSKKTLARHLQKVKCQRADIPNPEIPVRVQLFLSNVPELQNVIARIGTILVDGKVYPPPPGPGGPQGPPQNIPPGQNRNSKQPSPNVTPPLRPGMPGPGMTTLQPPNSNNGPGFSNVPPPMYNGNGGSQPGPPFPPNMPMGRSFSQDGPSPGNSFGRFPMGPPHGMPPQQHVSSSTHPQNIDISLRGLLNHSNQGGPSPQNNQLNNQFNSPTFMPGNGNNGLQQGGPSPHSMQQLGMRPNFMGAPGPGSHQGMMSNQSGPPNNAMMGGNAPRFPPNNFSRFMPPMRHMIPNQGIRFSGQQPPPGYNSNSPQAQQMQQQNGANQGNGSGAKWHIPQNMQSQHNNGFAGPSGLHLFGSGPNESFKIPLKSPDTMRNAIMMNSGNMMPNPHNLQHPNALPNVSSTNPKTPSPSTNEPPKDYTESIDKTCEDSVNDLMATIAKLDSNGVQVLPEGLRGKTTSPQVHSSTDLNAAASSGNTADGQTPQKDDPNEDWCAVCMDGGELMCCDKCPKVFHQSCHIPVIDSLPDESETWQCLLCYNFAILPSEQLGEKRGIGLTPLELKIMQRIVLELFCQYETSMPFRHLEPDINKTYYEIVNNPISLTMIREKLDAAHSERYTDIPTFIADVQRLFNNVYLYYQVCVNQEDTTTYKNARKLEKFFEQQLSKWLPKYQNTDNFVEDYLQNPAKRIKSLVEDD